MAKDPGLLCEPSPVTRVRIDGNDGVPRSFSRNEEKVVNAKAGSLHLTISALKGVACFVLKYEGKTGMSA